MPDALLCRVSADAGDAKLPLAAHELTNRALELAKAFLADERFKDCRLVFITKSAVSTNPGELPELTQAPLWGLMKSAQSEHPGRFVLVDADESGASQKALASALTSGQPLLALREGRLLAPRLARGPRSIEQAPLLFDPNQTVLITGGTGTLGSLLARHLAQQHGVKHLVLTSRRGSKAKGATTLRAALKELGATARIVACDVSDRDELAALIGKIPKTRPLGAVIHAAGTIDDGVITSLDQARIDQVLAPKLDAAWHLHELTKELDLGSFICFSSVAATVGSPGQANYAAANAFLDALAQHRRAKGLPAHSLAWGLWETASELTGDLTESDRERIRRMGIGALSSSRVSSCSTKRSTPPSPCWSQRPSTQQHFALAPAPARCRPCSARSCPSPHGASARMPSLPNIWLRHPKQSAIP